MPPTADIGKRGDRRGREGPDLAYRSEQTGSHVTLSGRTAQPLALAAARIAREMIRASLLRDGWTLLHASAVVRDDRALLTFGSKGAGKTTTALLLAGRGAQLLANDRVFVTTGCS